jgi:CheY-like chemotaxis protein
MTLIDSILFIDDDPVVNFHHISLSHHLKIAREIFVKTNGKEALDFIKERYYTGQSLPSLILLDLNMPIMNGKEFIQEVLACDLLGVKKIPMVILTTLFDSKEQFKMTNLGYSSMTKPLSEEKLFQIIQSLLPSNIVSL